MWKFGLFRTKFSQKQKELGDFGENVCQNEKSRYACPCIYRITLFIFWHRLTDLFMLFILWCVVKGGGGRIVSKKRFKELISRDPVGLLNRGGGGDKKV
jgi:hypothetical protein